MGNFGVLLESQQDILGPEPGSTYRLGCQDQLVYERTVCM